MPTRSAPPCTGSARLRLLRAFAVLVDHGIAAHPGIDGPPDAARRTLRDAVLDEFPDALGCHVFWTAEDEAAFAADGSLRRPLVLHHSGDDVARAAHAALAGQGLRVRDGADPGTLTVHPADNPAWSAVAPCRSAASP